MPIAIEFNAKTDAFAAAVDKLIASANRLGDAFQKAAPGWMRPISSLRWRRTWPASIRRLRSLPNFGKGIEEGAKKAGEATEKAGEHLSLFGQVAEKSRDAFSEFGQEVMSFGLAAADIGTDFRDFQENVGSRGRSAGDEGANRQHGRKRQRRRGSGRGL